MGGRKNRTEVGGCVFLLANFRVIDLQRTKNLMHNYVCMRSEFLKNPLDIQIGQILA
jgi:hypothetical protein